MVLKFLRSVRVNHWRRLSQFVFLALFLFLFRQTDYLGQDELPYAVNIFFRWDPLVAASAMLAAKTFIALLLPALIVVGLTFVLGRFFCGWVCPLGTLLDAAHTGITPKHKGPERSRYRTWKFYLLFLILIAALFGVPLVGYFDPFSILVRGLAIAVDPALQSGVSAPFDTIYVHAPGWVTDITEPVYEFLRGTIIAYDEAFFLMALPTLMVLVAVFALEKIERRFWCRNLCPLGALLGLCSRPALLRQHPGKACDKKCMTCADICRMGAIDEEGAISPEACNLCLDCVVDCDKKIISFKFKKPKAKPAPVGISRRGVVGALAAGLAVPAFLKVRAIEKMPDPKLIRPPGALDEDEFLSRCVRCGECMKVCINNALQPTFLEAGSEGIWSPMVVPRIGYCEYNCTLCGQVCPTGAIEKMAKEDKQKVKIGHAFFDKNLCMPYARGTPCLVCEEMCPLPEKAIRLRKATVHDQEGNEITLDQPYIVDNLCIGCGTCENKCPLPGKAGVRVTREGESRDPDSFVPPTGGPPPGYGGYGGYGG